MLKGWNVELTIEPVEWQSIVGAVVIGNNQRLHPSIPPGRQVLWLATNRLGGRCGVEFPVIEQQRQKEGNRGEPALFCGFTRIADDDG
jgi:hypothetical protein